MLTFKTSDMKNYSSDDLVINYIETIYSVNMEINNNINNLNSLLSSQTDKNLHDKMAIAINSLNSYLIELKLIIAEFFVLLGNHMEICKEFMEIDTNIKLALKKIDVTKELQAELDTISEECRVFFVEFNDLIEDMTKNLTFKFIFDEDLGGDTQKKIVLLQELKQEFLSNLQKVHSQMQEANNRFNNLKQKQTLMYVFYNKITALNAS